MSRDLNRCAMPVREEIAKVVASLQEFKAAKQVHDVVVVNLASTEPPLELQKCHEDLSTFEACLDRDEKGVVRASTIYAYAGIATGCPYINFTLPQAPCFRLWCNWQRKKACL